MRISTNTNLKDFRFWSQAKDNAARLSDDELDSLEATLEELYPEGINETKLNDIMWFDFQWICETLGLVEDEVYNREPNRRHSN